MKVGIEGDEIVIRVSIDALPIALEGSEMGHDFVVTDAPKFAKAIINELEHEDHGGVPVLHALFDAAMDRAIEGACDGVAERQKDEVPCPE